MGNVSVIVFLFTMCGLVAIKDRTRTVRKRLELYEASHIGGREKKIPRAHHYSDCGIMRANRLALPQVMD